jgi:molybdate transport system substrate-binding protein
MKISTMAAAGFSLLLTGAGVHAAEIKVMASGAMAHAIQDIAQDFAKKNGHMIQFVQGTTGTLQDKLRAGETPDIVQMTSGGIDQLDKEHLIAPGTRVELASALLGVAVPQNAPAPDVSSDEGLKTTLLSAKKIAYIDPMLGGQAGAAILNVVRKLGIEDAVVKKAVYGKTAISFASEIVPIKGAKSAGLIPEALQTPGKFAAAIGAKSANPGIARALLKELQSPEAKAVMMKAGLQPAK